MAILTRGDRELFKRFADQIPLPHPDVRAAVRRLLELDRTVVVQAEATRVHALMDGELSDTVDTARRVVAGTLAPSPLMTMAFARAVAALRPEPPCKSCGGTGAVDDSGQWVIYCKDCELGRRRAGGA